MEQGKVNNMTENFLDIKMTGVIFFCRVVEDAALKFENEGRNRWSCFYLNSVFCSLLLLLIVGNVIWDFIYSFPVVKYAYNIY